MDGDLKAEFPAPTSYLNSPMYITLEYNTGGYWPMYGLIANSHMDVDWVRVWALPANSVTPRALPPRPTPRK